MTKDWAQIERYKLTIAEKILVNGQWLNDLHVNAVPHVGGLQNTVVFQSTTFRPISKRSLQILHINSNHWIVASTLNNDVDISCMIH